MTGTALPRTVVLDLEAYEAGVATYSAPDWPTLSGEGLDGITVRLGRQEWDKLGRPDTVQVSYVVEVPQ